MQEGSLSPRGAVGEELPLLRGFCRVFGHLSAVDCCLRAPRAFQAGTEQNQLNFPFRGVKSSLLQRGGGFRAWREETSRVAAPKSSEALGSKAGGGSEQS